MTRACGARPATCAGPSSNSTRSLVRDNRRLSGDSSGDNKLPCPDRCRRAWRRSRQIQKPGDGPTGKLFRNALSFSPNVCAALALMVLVVEMLNARTMPRLPGMVMVAS